MNAHASEDAPIIVIDDDETMRRACQATLKRAGYQVETFADGASGLERIQQVRPGLLIVDLKMPGMSGIEVIERVKQFDPEIVVVVITGFATVTTAVEAMKAGAYDFIPKPFTAEELRVIIARGVERRQLTMEARRLREEKATQARKFITFVSHQLQSPLGAVQQYLQVLQRLMGDGGTDQQKEWIDRSCTKIEQMLHIIGDWLTLSKVEGGQLATERNAVKWREVVDQGMEGWQTAAEGRRVSLSSSLPADMPPVKADQPALCMLLANLVTNAVKYNREGGSVEISASWDDENVSLAVSDTGPGISEEDQQHVFEEFYRVKNGDAPQTAGTGLGLPICMRIVQELGGSLTLDSRVGEGTTFTVVLPKAESSEEGPTSADGES